MHQWKIIETKDKNTQRGTQNYYKLSKLFYIFAIMLDSHPDLNQIVDMDNRTIQYVPAVSIWFGIIVHCPAWKIFFALHHCSSISQIQLNSATDLIQHFATNVVTETPVGMVSMYNACLNKNLWFASRNRHRIQSCLPRLITNHNWRVLSALLFNP